MAQQSVSRLDRQIVEYLDHTHTIRHTHPVVLLRTTDQLVGNAATCTTSNKHKRRTPINSPGFEPAIPAD